MSNRKAEGFVSVHPRPLLFLLFEAALNESDFSLSFVFQEVAVNHCQPTKCPFPCDSPRCSLNAVQDSSERERERCWRWKFILPSYLFTVTAAVIVQVPLAERVWHHLQGSVKSLTHFVLCVFEGLSHAVSSLPGNSFLCISQKCSSSKLFFFPVWYCSMN